jgi:hypothetical protein
MEAQPIEIELLPLTLEETKSDATQEDDNVTRCWGPCLPPSPPPQEELEVLEIL